MTSKEIRFALLNALRHGARSKADVLRELFATLNPSQALLESSGRANIPKWQHRILTEVAHLRRSGKMTLHKVDPRRWSLSSADAAVVPAVSATEGRERLRLHKQRERSGTLRRQKIDDVLDRTGKLECECCCRDAEQVYGPIGQGYCEVHHHDAIANGERRTELCHLAVVCACCHRMLHRLIRLGLPSSIADLQKRLDPAHR